MGRLWNRPKWIREESGKSGQKVAWKKKWPLDKTNGLKHWFDG